MSNLRIQEFAGIGRGDNDDFQIISCPPLREQTPVAIGVSSVQSAAFGSQTKIICIQAEAICAVFVGGTNPTATAGQSKRLVAGQTEYLRVAVGDKLAVIQDT